MTDTSDLDELRSMARSPQNHSNYTLAGALHQALDRAMHLEAELAVAAARLEILTEAALAVLPSDDELALYRRQLAFDPCPVPPDYAEQWRKVLALHAAVRGDGPEYTMPSGDIVG